MPDKISGSARGGRDVRSPGAKHKTLEQPKRCCCDREEHMRVKPPAEWTREETLAIARALRNNEGPADRIVAEGAVGSRLRKAMRKDCAAEIYEMLELARAHLREEAMAAGRDGDAEDTEFHEILDGDGTREQFETPNFIIDYTTTAGAVDRVQDPSSDTAVTVTLANGTPIGTTLAGNGVPDFVEMTGIWLEHYLARFVTMGFNNPIQVDGGGNPIKQLVVIHQGRSFTSPGAPIRISRDLGANAGLAGGYNTPGGGLGTTPGHEVFHKVQHTYHNSNSGTYEFLKIYREGTARWAEDAVNDAYNKYNLELPEYLGQWARGLFTYDFGTSDPQEDDDFFTYETVLFWKYFSEQHGAVVAEPERGVDAIISLWQNLSGTTTAEEAITATSNTIIGLGGTGIEETFANFAVANYAKDLGNPFTDPAYDYLEDEEPGLGGTRYSSVAPRDTESISGLTPDYLEGSTLVPWGLHYYVFNCQPSVQDVTVTLTADPLAESFFRVLEIRGSAMTVHAGTGPSYEVTAARDVTDAAEAAISRVVVIAGAYRVGGAYDVTVTVNEGVPSVMLVLDRSGSMSRQGKMAAAQDAATLFVDVAEANGVPGLGAVGFSTTAEVLPNSALAALDSAHGEDVEDDIVALTPTGRTSIGHGLQVAAGQFVADPVGASNEVIVLLSDGQQNTAPMISEVQDDLITAGTKVYSVGLGTDYAIDPATLEDVATATMGDFRMTADPAELQEFYLQILATALGGDMDGSDDADSDGDTAKDPEPDVGLLVAPDRRAVVGRRKPIRVVSADRVVNVVLTTTSQGTDAFGLAAITPDGMVITEDWGDEHGVVFRRGRNYVMLSVPLPILGNHAGTWYAYALVPSADTSGYEIKAMLKSRLRLSALTETPTLTTGAPIGLRVRLQENGRPVAGATVRVRCDSPLLGVGNYLAQGGVAHPSEGSIAGDALSLRQLKLDALLTQTGAGVFERETKELTLAEAGSGDPGVYSGDLFTPSTPGSHNFTVEAVGRTETGEEFTRYLSFTKVVRVAVDSAATGWDLADTDPTAHQLAAKLTPADAYGNLLGPGFAPTMKVATWTGGKAGAITDHNDGSYSFSIDAGPEDVTGVSVMVGDSAIALPAATVRARRGRGDGPPEAGTQPLGLTRWTALVALVLALIALALLLADGA